MFVSLQQTLTNRAVSATSILLVVSLPLVFTNAEASSIVGTFADGYELGKKNGQEAYEEDTGHDSKCPPNDSLSYCAGYKAGYEAGWVAADTLDN
jgi:hypothetical protein